MQLGRNWKFRGGVNYLPSEMAAAIESIATGAKNFKTWEMTVVSESTSGLITLLEDDWINERRLEENLCVLIVPKEAPTTQYRLGFAFASNKMIYRAINGTNKIYGVLINASTSWDVRAQYSILNNSNASRALWARDRRLMYGAYASFIFGVGDYTVYMWY